MAGQLQTFRRFHLERDMADVCTRLSAFPLIPVDIDESANALDACDVSIVDLVKLRAAVELLR